MPAFLTASSALPALIGLAISLLGVLVVALTGLALKGRAQAGRSRRL